MSTKAKERLGHSLRHHEEQLSSILTLRGDECGDGLAKKGFASEVKWD
jgi:hypothetical protein